MVSWLASIAARKRSTVTLNHRRHVGAAFARLAVVSTASPNHRMHARRPSRRLKMDGSTGRPRDPCRLLNMPSHAKYWNLLFAIPIGAASLVALFVCNTIFIVSKEELTPLAAAAFGVAGLIAIMPWQLCQTLDPIGRDATRRSLVYAGCQMCSASLFFMSAAMLRYFYFHFQEMVTIEQQHHGMVKNAVSAISSVSFFVASIFFMFGVIRFGNTLSSILCDRHNET